jgi:glycosyltransferase involved in cell wall biosynthesis
VRTLSEFLSEEALYGAMVRELSSDRFDLIHDFSFDNLFVRRHPERLPFLASSCVPPRPGVRPPNVVACSEIHAQLYGPGARFVRYGLNLSDWPTRFDKERHLVHIAKIAPYKGQHEAAIAAAMAGRDLQIVGNVEHALYYRAVVAPLAFLLPGVSYLGETTSTSQALLPAAALVQTPKWFDAFPLIVLEALASGTPVIAYDEGGVREQIEHGVNGLLCNGVRELTEMMGRVDEIDSRACRAYAEAHFSIGRMADDYQELYQRVMAGESW